VTGKVVLLNALGVIVEDDNIFSLVKENNGITLIAFDPSLKIANRIATFKGMKGFILGAKKDSFLVDIDDKLFYVSDSAQRVVLKASSHENFFWHAVEAGDIFFVQEYGQTPTSIYASENLEDWVRLVTNSQLDKLSKHFHNITYDPYREWLVATLGDSCLTRAVCSKDMGKSWRSLYTGAWQFMPVVASKDELVFGMDSGIARGGIGIYHPNGSHWSFVFLRWRDKKIRLAQICDMKRLSNGLWIAALGTPQAIVVSKDLKMWYPIRVEGFYDQFNHNVMVNEGKDFVVCSTGKSLCVFNKNELMNGTLMAQPVMLDYNAYSERLKGLGFVLKRKILK
jgi:hypothetical protein